MADHDFSRYPSRELQVEWVRAYLCAFKHHSNGKSIDPPSVEAHEIDAWLDEIQNFTLVGFLFVTTNLR